MSLQPVLSVPLPSDFATHLGRALRLALDKSAWRFCFESSGEEFISADVTDPDGLLPLWLHRAQGLMAKSLDGKAGAMDFRQDGGALCGAVPDPQQPSASLAVWACYVHFAIEDWHKQHPAYVAENRPVPVDGLYQEWRALVLSRKIPLLPALAPPSVLAPTGFGLPSLPRSTD